VRGLGFSEGLKGWVFERIIKKRNFVLSIKILNLGFEPTSKAKLQSLQQPIHSTSTKHSKKIPQIFV
jgi:hypothetical protein